MKIFEIILKLEVESNSLKSLNLLTCVIMKLLTSKF